MNIREQIMERLRDVGNAADTTDDFRWNHARALPAIADECIRQMKWTYLSVKWTNPESHVWVDDVCDIMEGEKNELTLAPEDWKP